jgi:transcriptional regulator with XRE-family HTH domain
MSIGKDKIITTESKQNVIMLSMEISFSEWLQQEIDLRGWSWNKLSVEAGLSSGTIYNIRDGVRGVGEDSLKSIAKALKLPPDQIFRRAGVLPPTKIDDDPLTEEAEYLISELSHELREQAINYIRYLYEQQEGKRVASRVGKARPGIP